MRAFAKFAAAVSAASAVLASTATIAAPFVFGVGYTTDRYAPNSVPGFSDDVGNRVQWFLNVRTDGICGDARASFSRGASGPFNLGLSTDPIFSTCLFAAISRTTFSDEGLLTFAGSADPWTYSVTDGTPGATTGAFPTIVPQLLPFASDIAVSDASTTPLVTWHLPELSGFDVERLRLRVITDAGLQIFQTDLLPTATSYQMPAGFLQGGSRYFYRIIIEDLEAGRIENRSSAFSAVAYQVPEPGTLALLGLGLAGIAVARRRRQ